MESPFGKNIENNGIRNLHVPDALAVATAIHFSKKMLTNLTNVTFLYDPSWIPSFNAADGDSLPFAFLHVISDEVLEKNNVSTKRILLYEPDKTNADLKDSIRPSVLEVVADNIVSEPPVHTIDCYVPYGFVTKLFSLAKDVVHAVLAQVAIFGGKDAEKVTSGIREISSVAVATSTYMQQLLDMVGKFASFTNASYNVDSISAMRRRGAILQYKTWQGAQSKYVVIRNFQQSKQGIDGDYVKCKLELQEVPVMFVGETGLPTVKTAGISTLQGQIAENITTSFEKSIAAIMELIN